MEDIITTFGEIPKDFWDIVVVHEPKKLGDAIKFKKPFNNLLNNFESELPQSLFKLIKNGKHIGVCGNGLCGIYSCLAEIILNNHHINNMDHKLFIEQIIPIMEEYGIYGIPSTIEGDILCKIMETYIKMYIDIEHPSFAIFSLDDQSVKFYAQKDSRCFTNNLITIVHNNLHFEALLYNEKKRKKIYLELQKFMENN
jgi:hypothetical protein